MRRDDLMSALICLGFSLFIIVESYRLDIGTFHSPQAGFLPFFAAIVLAILSLVLFLTAGSAKLEAPDKIIPSFNRERFPKILYVALSVFIYAMLLNPVGFLITTILFIGFLLKAVESQRWYVVVAVAGSASMGSYLIFDVLLKVQLPKGLLGF
jgi:putative tricarboxylic transport membrane protein